MQLSENAPFTSEQRKTLGQALSGLSPEQITWLSGFLAGTQNTAQAAPQAAATQGTQKRAPLTILYGTESGNSEELAQRAKKVAQAKGFSATVKDMGDYAPDKLEKEENLVVIVSTWGEGDPPDRAAPFYEALMGDGAPKLSKLRFAVLALGDTAYESFCKTGKDFDSRLEVLGGERFYPRTDCDVDYEEPYQKWIEGALHKLASLTQPEDRKVSTNGAAVASPADAPAYGKKNPFPSALKERVLLNGTGSAKETWHLELSLEGSGMSYAPGDALALIPSNAEDVVDSILKTTGLSTDARVPGNAGSEVDLHEALTAHYDVTGLTKSVIRKYNTFAQSDKLAALQEPESKDELHAYLWGRQIVDLLEDFPVKGLSADALVGCMRKMPPRLYSIASSLKAHPDEVHLTIASVRYHSHNRDRKGVASTYIADDLDIGDTVPVYTHVNKNFKLPESNDTPMIMVGPGTGIAPFRSFIEERAAIGAKGKNWLIFGDQRFSYDFLYQTEWQDYLKDGILSNIDLAFSRDQPQKIYVQDRMLEKGKELYAWLEEGAHFYVCGDASRMAADVQNALLKIAQDHGGKSEEQADEWLKALRKDKRYQRDVY